MVRSMSTAGLRIPDHLMLGAGPSPVPTRVREALALPIIGHMDPTFVAVSDEVRARLRKVWATENEITLPLSGTGSLGMEAAVVNFVDPGDTVVCGVHGVFGERMADELERNGATVVRVEGEWGRALEPERLIGAADTYKAMFVVHAETSTGVLQPLDGLAEACRDRGALLIVDCVTSLGGVPIKIDESQIDVAFAATQKCLNAPPGLAPFTVGPRAAERIRAGRSWYLDLSLLLGYYADSSAATRAYHHTAPINLVYALHEALGLVLEEGLEARWERHRQAHDYLREALARRGFRRVPLADEALASLLCVRVPDGINEAALRDALVREYGIEVSGGLGPLAGRVWRIGVMGDGAKLGAQGRLLTALDDLL